jgi:hypothetical protein
MVERSKQDQQSMCMGFPAKVLAQYVWLRETLFWRVIWAARYFGIEIA